MGLKLCSQPADLRNVSIYAASKDLSFDDVRAALGSLVKNFEADASASRAQIRNLLDNDRDLFYVTSIEILKTAGDSRGAQYLVALLVSNGMLLEALVQSGTEPGGGAGTGTVRPARGPHGRGSSGAQPGGQCGGWRGPRCRSGKVNGYLVRNCRFQPHHVLSDAHDAASQSLSALQGGQDDRPRQQEHEVGDGKTKRIGSACAGQCHRIDVGGGHAGGSHPVEFRGRRRQQSSGGQRVAGVVPSGRSLRADRCDQTRRARVRSVSSLGGVGDGGNRRSAIHGRAAAVDLGTDSMVRKRAFTAMAQIKAANAHVPGWREVARSRKNACGGEYQWDAAPDARRRRRGHARAAQGSALAVPAERRLRNTSRRTKLPRSRWPKP